MVNLVLEGEKPEEFSQLDFHPLNVHHLPDIENI